MNTAAQSWYRVEVDGGNIISLRLVASAGSNTRRVYFVLASSDEGASHAALMRYKAYLESQRTQTAQRRERYRAEGKCRCGSEPEEGLNMCRACLQQSEESKSRARAAARGEPVVKPPKSVAIANRKKLEAVKFRRLLMQEVLHNWYEMPATKFIAWLEKEAGED